MSQLTKRALEQSLKKLLLKKPLTKITITGSRDFCKSLKWYGKIVRLS